METVVVITIKAVEIGIEKWKHLENHLTDNQW